VNAALKGATYPPVTFVVDPARVAAFRSIFGQEDGVPPTFATVAEFTVLPMVVEDPRLELDFTRVVHGSQSYEFHRPLHEGETLSVVTRIEAIRTRGDSGFITIAMDITGPDGEIACTARSTMIERPPG
jgi:acyl dehydratase